MPCFLGFIPAAIRLFVESSLTKRSPKWVLHIDRPGKQKLLCAIHWEKAVRALRNGSRLAVFGARCAGCQTSSWELSPFYSSRERKLELPQLFAQCSVTGKHPQPTDSGGLAATDKPRAASKKYRKFAN